MPHCRTLGHFMHSCWLHCCSKAVMSVVAACVADGTATLSLGRTDINLPIWIDDVDCTMTCRPSSPLCDSGPSSTLASCYYKGRNWGSHDCAHHEDVGLRCSESRTPNVYGSSPTTYGSTQIPTYPATYSALQPNASGPNLMPALWEGAVRLTGGAGPWEGRLEIYHDNQWGTVCDDGWSEANTLTVCQELGYSGVCALD
jgi:hypothetical protein